MRTLLFLISGFKKASGAVLTIIIFACFLAVILNQSYAEDSGQNNAQFQWDIKSDYQFALKQNNKIVWQFNAEPSNASKPYFDPLCVVGCKSLSLPDPSDHPWHLGHWFSWKYINGVNYWETDKKGIAQGETFWSKPRRVLNRNGSASIFLEVGYRPRKSKSDQVLPLVKEQREIIISVPEIDGSYILDWVQEFTAMEDVTFDRTAIPGEKNGVDWGGYAGLSIRFSNELREVKTVAANSAKLHRRKNNCLDFYDADGVEQNGVIDGREYGIAILSHPDSQYGRNWYVIEEKNFTYINAATLLHGAVKLSKGEVLKLCHRVHVHKGRWDAVKLNEAASKYKLTSPKISEKVLPK
jgi:hypothetical protein